MVKMAANYFSGTLFRVLPIMTSLTVMDTEFSGRSRSPSSDDRDVGSPVQQRGRSRRSRGRSSRGQSRGRGRGRGNRGRGNPRTEFSETRMVHLEERVNSMTAEDMRATTTEICRVQPSLLLHILDHCKGEPRPEGSSQDQPSWCSCSYCWEMPTEQERVCCNRTPQNCNSRLPDFDNCVLDELVLELSIRYRNDILAQPADQDYNKCHRFAAYRQYIHVLWTHGHLGAGNRRVIPSCCIWRIRDKYPDVSGQYIGFIGGRLGLQNKLIFMIQFSDFYLFTQTYIQECDNGYSSKSYQGGVTIMYF